MKLRPHLLLAAPALLLASCMVGPDYVRTDLNAPSAFKEDSGYSHDRSWNSEWWTVFRDDRLSGLVTQALSANLDLATAEARLREAQANLGISAADLLPTVSASSSADRSRSSQQPAESQGSTSNGNPWSNFFSTAATASYEFDFWGKYRRGLQSSQARVESSAAALDLARLTVASAVAQTYFLIRSLDAESEIIVKTIETRKVTTDLQNTRFTSGLINETDLSRARTDLATAEAERYNIRLQREQAEHSLAILLGQAPSAFDLPSRPLASSPPRIPAGLPADALARRPDLRAAERDVAAASASIGVAVADYFPSISLTGSAGFASNDLGELLTKPASTASFGPSLTLPIFTAGRTRANVGGAQARYEQAATTYRQSALVALGEVEDALSSLKNLSGQFNALDRAVESSRRTLELSRDRYLQGLVNYLEVADAERSLLSIERSRQQTLAQRYTATISLIKALGGSWGGATPTAK